MTEERTKPEYHGGAYLYIRTCSWLCMVHVYNHVFDYNAVPLYCLLTLVNVGMDAFTSVIL